MKSVGLTLDGIVAAATKMVKKKGYNSFTMRELAKELHCKAPSIYNHISGIDELNLEIGRYAAREMNAVLEQAIEGKERDDAVKAIAHSYRSFVKEQYELFQAIMGAPALEVESENGTLVGHEGMKAIRSVIEQYQVSRSDEVNISRCFRASLQGFALNEMAGYYCSKDVAVDESFEVLIQHHIQWMKEVEAKRKKESKPA